MANITSKTGITPDPTDKMYVVDVSDTTDNAAGSDKHATVDNLLSVNDSRTKTLTNTTIDADGTGNSVSNIAVADLSATGTKDATTFLRGDNTFAAPAGGGGGDLLAANNLSDVASAATALTNLGAAPALGVDDNYVTDAEKTVVGNTSGTNTGDQTSVTGNSGSTNALKSATTTVDVASATAPTSGQALIATSGTAATWQTLAGSGDALVANPLSQFAATTSAQLAGVLSDETGSGGAVFATSPTLVTPALGTPSALVATNATGTAASLTAGNATQTNALKSATTTVNVASATAPSTGQVLTATGTASATWQTPTAGGGGDVYVLIGKIDLDSTWTGAPNYKIQDAGTIVLDSQGYWLFNSVFVSDSATVFYNTSAWLALKNPYDLKMQFNTIARVKHSTSNSAEAFFGTVDISIPSKTSIPINKTRRHVGFYGIEVSGTRTWYASHGNGSTQTTTDITASISDDTWYRYRIDYDGVADSIKYYVDGTLVATHTTSIPSGSGINAIGLVVAMGNTGAVGGSAPEMKLAYADMKVSM